MLRDWKAVAVAAQLAMVTGCVLLGAHVLAHPNMAPAVRVARSTLAGVAAMPPAPVALPSPRSAPARAAAPALGTLAERANRDDALLYHEQWQMIELMASATRLYMERHVVPLLLAAARGGVK